MGGEGFIRGVVGRIEWGYYPAAAINGYSVSKRPDGRWSLRATLVTANAYNLAQRPLVFVAPHEKGEWRWPVEQIDTGSALGPREIVAALGEPLP